MESSNSPLFVNGHFNTTIFAIGVLLSIGCVFLLRKQLFVTPKQWYKRMIPHHSTALTTSSILLKNNKDFVNKNPKLNKLVNDIIKTQESEIKIMKNMLKK